MRFNRTQLNEHTANAHAKGLKEGRRKAFRKGVYGFLFGTLTGSGGLFLCLFYWDHIVGFIHGL